MQPLGSQVFKYPLTVLTQCLETKGTSINEVDLDALGFDLAATGGLCCMQTCKNKAKEISNLLPHIDYI